MPSSLAMPPTSPSFELASGFGRAASRLFYWAATESDEALFLGNALPLVAPDAGRRIRGHRRRGQGSLANDRRFRPAARSVPDELLAGSARSSIGPWYRGAWSCRPLRPSVGAKNASFIALGTRPSNSRRNLRNTVAVAGRRARRKFAADSTTGSASPGRRRFWKSRPQWTRTLQMDKLLARIAEAATKLLHAERASIFLWDRATHTLVGRPALGVEGGELRIADDAGIVGQVVHSGQPRRVDADIGRRAARDRSPRRSAAEVSNAIAAVRSAARQKRRTVRRV